MKRNNFVRIKRLMPLIGECFKISWFDTPATESNGSANLVPLYVSANDKPPYCSDLNAVNSMSVHARPI